ncbi:sugar MFS transporter [Niabella drilacis]|uniref:MFS transporter, FHS family, L-fucose permease n=1 Tax=Niabella drilacis (strain DSM 25811 / CCM 8410 / CCUG 62505 / LMG 26954 / E90) TaxID=1285928 RepID=A0A1G6JLL4_NIADE|nr:sugar MFS transporter [Niabella drilacis]SDC19561.1 MFS transporter, FHS family, L-fucose permease [Niabella drilacis]
MSNKKSLFIRDGVNYAVPFAAISALFFLWGVAHGLLDALDKNFQEMLHLKKWQSSLIQFHLYGAYAAMAIPAGLFMKKYGYKKGVIFGLILFATGALLAAVTAPVQSFVLFLFCLLIIGCGLATLETAANPYTTKLGPPETAERRINFSQSFNGLAWTVGPLIAIYIYGNRSHVEGEKMMSIVLPFALIGLAVLVVALIFKRLKLPEITEEDENAAHGIHNDSATTATGEAMDVSDPSDSRYITKKPLWQNRHFKLGVIAQACYVGAQTGVFSYLINFLTDDKDMHMEPRFKVADGPYFLSIGFALFMIGRISGSALMKYFKPAKLLAFYSLAVCLLLPVVGAEIGWPSVIALYGVFFFMSIMFPTIFALAIKGLGPQTKRGAAFLVMSVAGGAIFPLLMGAISDTYGMAVGFFVPIPLFLFILYYATNGYKVKA